MANNLEKFKDKLKNIEQSRYKKKTTPKALGVGMKISLDLISPIIVGVLIGLGFDKIFSTKPIFFLIFLLLGIITGFISVIKSMKSLK